MDFNTVIGVVLAFILVLGAMSIGQGGVAVFIHIPSMIIVFGGTIMVTMLAFPLSDLKPVADHHGHRGPQGPHSDRGNRPDRRVRQPRSEGGPARPRNELQQVDDPFFAKGIQLVVDGFGADTVRDIMELEAQWEDARHSSGKKIMDQLGAFAPAFEMIGTLVGLVQMLQDLSDPNGIGLGMATALLTTLYGRWARAWSSSPWRASWSGRQDQPAAPCPRWGTVAIQSGEKPQLIKEKLKGFPRR